MLLYEEKLGIHVTAAHLRVAEALYAARPILISALLNEVPPVIGPAVGWDDAPVYYKLDMLELAHVALLATDPMQGPHSSSEETAGSRTG